MLPHPKVWKMLLSESWGVYDAAQQRSVVGNLATFRRMLTQVQ